VDVGRWKNVVEGEEQEADEQPGYINSHWKVDHKGTMVLQRDRKSIY
jgi:hypothetical protein